MPDKIKTAVRDMAYSIVDRGIQKTSSILDKGIQYLQAKKEEVLNLSPLEKKRQAMAQEQQREQQTVRKRQALIQHGAESMQEKRVPSIQYKGTNSIKKPRKQLLQVESNGSVHSSKEQGKERSM